MAKFILGHAVDCGGSIWSYNESFNAHGEMTEIQLWETSSKVVGIRVKFGQTWSDIHGDNTENLKRLVLEGEFEIFKGLKPKIKCHSIIALKPIFWEQKSPN